MLMMAISESLLLKAGARPASSRTFTGQLTRTVCSDTGSDINRDNRTPDTARRERRAGRSLKAARHVPLLTSVARVRAGHERQSFHPYNRMWKKIFHGAAKIILYQRP
jgi:hypothetical protein